MKPIGRIQQDKRPIDFSEGEVFYRKNAVITEKVGSIINENGVAVVGSVKTTLNAALGVVGSTNLNWHLCGNIPCDGDRAILFFVSHDSGGTVYSAIVLYDQDTFTLKLKRLNTGVLNGEFNFDIQYPITGEFNRNFNNELIITFTDNNTVPKYLNISTYSQASSLPNVSKFFTFPDSDQPQFAIPTISLGGNHLSGAYWIAIKYSNSDGSDTSYIAISRVIYLTDGNYSNATQLDGCEAGTQTGKIISIAISNLDTNYDFFEVAVVTKINGILTAVHVEQAYSITSTSATLVLSGSEQTTDITLDEVLAIPAVYSTVKVFTQLQGTLYGGNVKTYGVEDFQAYANDIVVDWTIEGVTTIDNAVNKEGNQANGFQAGETYAFYLHYIYADGTETNGFTIPGRVVGNTTYSKHGGGLLSENDLIKDVKDINGVGGDTYANEFFKQDCGIDGTSFLNYSNSTVRFYQVRDTCKSLGTSPSMGYWENQSETYSSTFPDFPTQKVRHHRFPTHNFIRGDAASLTALAGFGAYNQYNYGVNYLPVIGVKFSNVVIPTSARTIVGYKISYAKRDLTNSTFVAMTDYWLANGIRTSASALENSTLRNYNSTTINNLSIVDYIDIDTTPITQIYSNGANLIQVDGADDRIPIELYGKPCISSTGDIIRGASPDPYKVTSIPLKARINDLYINNPSLSSIYLSNEYIILPTQNTTPFDTVTGIDDADLLNNVYVTSTINAVGRASIDFTVSTRNLSYGVEKESFNFPITYFQYLPANSIDSTNNLNNLFNEDECDFRINGIIHFHDITTTATGFEVYTDTTSPVGQLLRPYFGSELISIESRFAIYDEVYQNANDFNSPYRIGGWADASATRVTPTPPNYSSKTFTHVASVRQWKTDCYQGYYNQDLIECATVIGSTSNITTALGDMFISQQCYQTYTALLSQAYNNNVSKKYDNATLTDTGESFMGIRYTRRLLINSTNNLNLIYENPVTYSSEDPNNNSGFGLYYPKSASNLVTRTVLTIPPNQFKYNTDYSARLFKPLFPYNRNIVYPTSFPYRIIVGQPLTKEGSSVNWRKWLVNNYYEQVKHRGEIINIQGQGNDRLLIHHMYSLFRTRSIGQIQTGIIAATIGTGELFALPPEEVLFNGVGYAGTQHKFSCLMTEFGYMFTDAKYGNIFLFTDELELIVEGLRLFFRDNLPNTFFNNTPDNPYGYDNPYYVNSNITVGFDRIYRRFLYFFNTGSEVYSLSYSPDYKSWISLHDNVPAILFNTRSYLYAFCGQFDDNTDNSSKMFRHSVGNKGVYYLINGNISDGSSQGGIHYDPKPLILDTVFNFTKDDSIVAIGNLSPLITKLLDNVQWISEVYDSNNTKVTVQTFTSFSAWNDYQHTGVITLDTNTVWGNSENNRYTESTWNFNRFRNTLKTNPANFINTLYNEFNLITSEQETKSWYRKDLMRDKYFIVRLKFENCDKTINQPRPSTNKTIYLHNIDVNTQTSYR